jgi:hypothetical protein
MNSYGQKQIITSEFAFIREQMRITTKIAYTVRGTKRTYTNQRTQIQSTHLNSSNFANLSPLMLAHNLCELGSFLWVNKLVKSSMIFERNSIIAKAEYGKVTWGVTNIIKKISSTINFNLHLKNTSMSNCFVNVFQL